MGKPRQSLWAQQSCQIYFIFHVCSCQELVKSISPASWKCGLRMSNCCLNVSPLRVFILRARRLAVAQVTSQSNIIQSGAERCICQGQVLTKPLVHKVVPYKTNLEFLYKTLGCWIWPFFHVTLPHNVLLRLMLWESTSGDLEVGPMRKRVSLTADLHHRYWASSSVTNTGMKDLILIKYYSSCNDTIHCKTGHKLECATSLSLFAQHKHIIRWYMRTELMAFANNIKFHMFQKS